jgi:hypothetical protein
MYEELRTDKPVNHLAQIESTDCGIHLFWTCSSSTYLCYDYSITFPVFIGRNVCFPVLFMITEYDFEVYINISTVSVDEQVTLVSHRG